MTRKTMTPERYQEIKRLLDMGPSVIKICASVKATKRTVQAIRDGKMPNPATTPKKALEGPPWASLVPWEEVHLRTKAVDHSIKLAWEEYAKLHVSYTGFLRQLYKRYPQMNVTFSTPRDVPMGKQCEVDYMGFQPKWFEQKTGEIHSAPIFVGSLGGSQLIFACAKSDAKGANFIDCHVQMYSEFGGVPHITVPDNLKTGVIKPHIFDPEINSSYADMARHYGTAIVPARVRRPKDKPIVEGAVRLVTRLFKWRYKGHTFTSLGEIDQAVKSMAKEINNKIHTRFKISRCQLWQEEELGKLKKLPGPFEYFEGKKAKVHPDSHIALEGDFYSVPYRFLGGQVTVKFNSRQVRIFSGLDSIAVHNRATGRKGKRVTIVDHLPENAKAYRSATPQSILSQAQRLSKHLHQLIEQMFQQDTIGNIRRAQGMINETKKALNANGSMASDIIENAVEQIIQTGQIRVPIYRDLLKRFSRLYTLGQRKKSTINRNANPMLRHQQLELKLKENDDGKHVVH